MPGYIPVETVWTCLTGKTPWGRQIMPEDLETIQDSPGLDGGHGWVRDKWAIPLLDKLWTTLFCFVFNTTSVRTSVVHLLIRILLTLA